MRTLLVATLLLSALLAGCTSPPADPPAPDTTSSPTTSQAAGPSDDAPVDDPGATALPNQPPTVLFTADIAAGQAPLTVTFSFNATDADSNALDWTLDADGDAAPDASGDVLPGSHPHVFDVAGSYTATFVVSDGMNDTAASFQIEVSAVPVPEEPAPVVLAGTVMGIALGCFDPDDPPSVLLGSANNDFDVDAAWWGGDYELTPSEAEIVWWQGEGLDDPLVVGADTATIPADTTSGHVCVDSDPVTGFVAVPGLPVDWTLTIYLQA